MNRGIPSIRDDELDEQSESMMNRGIPSIRDDELDACLSADRNKVSQ